MLPTQFKSAKRVLTQSSPEWKRDFEELTGESLVPTQAPSTGETGLVARMGSVVISPFLRAPRLAVLPPADGLGPLQTIVKHLPRMAEMSNAPNELLRSLRAVNKASSAVASDNLRRLTLDMAGLNALHGQSAPSGQPQSSVEKFGDLFKKFTCIKSMTLNGAGFTDDHLGQLPKDLKHLTLAGVSSITAKGFKRHLMNVRLESLTLNEKAYHNVKLIALTQHPTLTTLNLENMRRVPSRLPHATAQALVTLPRLTTLQLRGRQVPDESLFALTSHKGLKVLGLSETRGYGHNLVPMPIDIITALAGMPQLQTLDLN